MQIESKTFHTAPHSNTTHNMAHPATSFRTTTPSTVMTERINTTHNLVQPPTSFRTTTPSTAMTGRMTTKQVNPVQDTPCKALLEHCMHVHQPVSQVCKPGESLALRKVNFCEQTPIDKARHFVTIFQLL